MEKSHFQTTIASSAILKKYNSAGGASLPFFFLDDSSAQKGKSIFVHIILAVYLLLFFQKGEAVARFREISPEPPETYGNILLNRKSSGAGQLPVAFSHWRHRTLYTCRVCHLELGFEMKANTTDITETKNRHGRHCGACHDGVTAFGHTREHCRKCHNGDRRYGSDRFKELASLPASRYGNRIDWTESVRRGMIAPKQTIRDGRLVSDLFNKSMRMEPVWADFEPAVFPHEVHNYWLDCANCHPDIFNIKKNTTKHLSMHNIGEGGFCGVCHLSVAFPLNECRKCHPPIAR